MIWEILKGDFLKVKPGAVWLLGGKQSFQAGGNHVNRTLFAGLIALPFAASANPIPTSIPDTKTFVDVEVWGIVYESDASVGDKWANNDPIYRKLTFDLSLAPPDRYTTPRVGLYVYNDQSCEPNCPPPVPAPSFIRTSGWTFEGMSRDYLELADIEDLNGDRLSDSYSVEDLELLFDATGRVTQGTSFSALIHQTFDFRYDFVNGDSIAQSFDITVGGGRDAQGVIWELIDGVRNYAYFHITRMRSTPRVCRP
jgi:hypothetical protein